MRAPKISAVILSGFIKFALFIYSIIYRPKNLEHGEVQIEDCFRHRSFRKWLSVIFRIIPLVIFLYKYGLWIMKQRDSVLILLHASHFVFAIPSYSWIYGLQLFQRKALLQLVKRIHRLCRRVRSLALQKNDGFGGKREMVLIILFLLSQVLEVVLFFQRFNPNDIVGYLSLQYVVMFIRLGIRIHVVWYLHVGVMYSEVNDYVRHKVKHLRNPQGYQILIGQLEDSLSLYREIYDITTRFQAMFNLILFLCLMHYLLHFAVFSYDMIININFGDFWIWLGFLRIILEFLLITLSVEGAGNQFKGIRQIQFEMCCFDENKDFQRLVEVFATQLNLYAFRVRLLDLCDVSKELFLQILSGIVAYLIFIVQCVLQIKKS